MEEEEEDVSDVADHSALSLSLFSHRSVKLRIHEGTRMEIVREAGNMLPLRLDRSEASGL